MELLRYEIMLPSFALVVARMSGILLAVPMFSSNQLPRLTRVLLVVVLSLMAYPVVSSKIPTTLTIGQAGAGMVGEFVVGEILGLAAGSVFFAAQIAGKIVSHQSGFALGQVFNPLFDEEFTVLDQLWFFVAFMFFLALRGHIAVIMLVLRSFEHVPPMTFLIDQSVADFAVGMTRSMFDVALRLSGPAVLALLLASLVMGFLTKTMPQLNVISVGFAFKIFIALVLVAITISSSGDLMTRSLADGLDQAGQLFEHLAEAATNG